MLTLYVALGYLYKLQGKIEIEAARHRFFKASNLLARARKSSSAEGGLEIVGGVIGLVGLPGLFNADFSGLTAALLGGGWFSTGGMSGSLDAASFSSRDNVSTGVFAEVLFRMWSPTGLGMEF